MQLPRFEDLAASPDAPLDLLALALAAAFRPVEAARALATLDGLGAEVARVLRTAQRARLERRRSPFRTCWGQCTASPGTPSSTTGRRTRCSTVCSSVTAAYRSCSRPYMSKRHGGPMCRSPVSGCPAITWSPISVAPEPLLLDPFNGGVEVTGDAPAALVRPWSPHQTAMRMLNNLVPAFRHRGDLTRALRAAECDSRFRPRPTSATACVPSSSRFAPGSTERACRFRQ